MERQETPTDNWKRNTGQSSFNRDNLSLRIYPVIYLYRKESTEYCMAKESLSAHLTIFCTVIFFYKKNALIFCSKSGCKHVKEGHTLYRRQ